MRAPGRATITLMPARTFGAPQTIWRASSSPTLTWQTWRCVSGTSSQDKTSPTTIFERPVAGDSTPSTSIPVVDIFSANSSDGTSTSTNCFNHLYDTNIILIVRSHLVRSSQFLSLNLDPQLSLRILLQMLAQQPVDIHSFPCDKVVLAKSFKSELFVKVLGLKIPFPDTQPDPVKSTFLSLF